MGCYRKLSKVGLFASFWVMQLFHLSYELSQAVMWDYKTSSSCFCLQPNCNFVIQFNSNIDHPSCRIWFHNINLFPNSSSCCILIYQEMTQLYKKLPILAESETWHYTKNRDVASVTWLTMSCHPLWSPQKFMSATQGSHSHAHLHWRWKTT